MTASIFDLFATDQKSEVEGVVYNVTPEISFTLARAGGANMRYSKVLAARMRPYTRQITDESIDLDLVNDILIEVFAETVILGWKGITDAEDKEISFTVQNAIALFKQLPDLFTDVREYAGKMANYRAQEITDAVGN